MDGNQEPQTWQELLKQILEDPTEKERIAQEVKITVMTLRRWVQGVSMPREEHMRALLNAVPPSYPQFAQLIALDFPGLAPKYSLGENIQVALPLEFYTRVLNAAATTPPSLYQQAMLDLILQQMIRHFDPRRRGLAISVSCCVSPRTGYAVRSLHEIAGIGTPPWNRDLDSCMIFLGAESLIGTVVTNCRLMGVPNRADGTRYPVHWVEHEQSAIAYPLMHKARIAGSLLISSAHPHVFSEVHHRLIVYYADLLALAFEPSAFFDSKDIALRMMPSHSHQMPFLRQFRQRVLQKVAHASAQGQLLTLSEAQGQVWQEIEEELLELAVVEM